jgi:hypothetical protein
MVMMYSLRDEGHSRYFVFLFAPFRGPRIDLLARIGPEFNPVAPLKVGEGKRK